MPGRARHSGSAPNSSQHATPRRCPRAGRPRRSSRRRRGGPRCTCGGDPWLSSCAVRAFASDNYAPILPEALEAIAAANHGHADSYGADEWTDAAARPLGRGVRRRRVVFPVFNGTGANVVGLRAMLRPWQGVICAESAHLNVDECGAPEVDGRDQAADRADARRQAHARAGGPRGSCGSATSTSSSPASSRSRSRPSSGRCTRSRSCARCASTRTRTGCCSTSTARGWPTPAASLDVLAAAIMADVGADVVSLGGTKIGLLAGEAVIVLNAGARALAAVPAQAVDAARVEDAVRVGAAARAVRGRRVAARGRARERDGVAAGRRRRATRCRSRRRSGQRGLRDPPAGRGRRSCSATSSSTSGTSTPARCAGCAPGTRPRRTSTRSSRRSRA